MPVWEDLCFSFRKTSGNPRQFNCRDESALPKLALTNIVFHNQSGIVEMLLLYLLFQIMRIVIFDFFYTLIYDKYEDRNRVKLCRKREERYI